MNKWQAWQQFWEGFDIPAYDVQSVPDNAVFPYITYEAQIDSLDRVLSLTTSVWYRSSSWKGASDKAQEIEQALGNGGVTIPLDLGYLWINKGTPFAQRLTEPNDDLIKRIVINIQAEYLSR